MFSKAGQPEILRAAQRDDAFQKQLYTSVSELLYSGLGVRLWMKYREVARIASCTLYQLLTTMSNLQTLGEEYTGMIQINSAQTLPSKHVRLLMILLNTCGETIVIEFLKQFEKYISTLPSDHSLRPEARMHLMKASSSLRDAIPFVQRIHKAVFYFKGDHYHISKRLSGIRYVLVRHWLRDRSSLPTFRLLGVISLLHLGLHSLLGFVKLRMSGSQPQTEDRVSLLRKSSGPIESRDKCALCLNFRQNTSLTSCGHMFCWSCIIPWLQEQPKCPLCRQTVLPSRVVLLQNYSYIS